MRALRRTIKGMKDMSEGIVRFQQHIGRAALKLWPDLPRDVQERLFEEPSAVTRP